LEEDCSMDFQSPILQGWFLVSGGEK